MAPATSPPLHTYHGIASVEQPQFHSIHNAPLETRINILLPWYAFEVLRLRHGIKEGIHAAIEMAVARGSRIASDHDDGTDGAILADQASGGATGAREVSMEVKSHTGEGREMTYEVVSTTIAPAFWSKLADTADTAIVSEMRTGRGVTLCSSWKALR